ncbi:hypothetical protein ACVNIS_17635 [Sphaerotilaceae bacterium SBD11-9]
MQLCQALRQREPDTQAALGTIWPWLTRATSSSSSDSPVAMRKLLPGTLASRNSRFSMAHWPTTPGPARPPRRVWAHPLAASAWPSRSYTGRTRQCMQDGTCSARSTRLGSAIWGVEGGMREG